MTLDQLLDKAARELDDIIERDRARFEQSIIDNLSAVTDLDLLLEHHDRVSSEWRAATLAEIRRNLLTVH